MVTPREFHATCGRGPLRRAHRGARRGTRTGRGSPSPSCGPSAPGSPSRGSPRRRRGRLPLAKVVETKPVEPCPPRRTATTLCVGSSIAGWAAHRRREHEAALTGLRMAGDLRREHLATNPGRLTDAGFASGTTRRPISTGLNTTPRARFGSKDRRRRAAEGGTSRERQTAAAEKAHALRRPKLERLDQIERGLEATATGLRHEHATHRTWIDRRSEAARRLDSLDTEIATSSELHPGRSLVLTDRSDARLEARTHGPPRGWLGPRSVAGRLT